MEGHWVRTLPQTWRSCHPGPCLVTTQGLGLLGSRQGSCFLPSPWTPGSGALSRLQTTFLGCGVNNLFQVLEFCYPRWPSLGGGLFSLFSPSPPPTFPSSLLFVPMVLKPGFSFQVCVPEN